MVFGEHDLHAGKGLLAIIHIGYVQKIVHDRTSFSGRKSWKQISITWYSTIQTAKNQGIATQKKKYKSFAIGRNSDFLSPGAPKNIPPFDWQADIFPLQ